VSGFLLDTNVISELTRPEPDAYVVEWLDSVDESLLYVSVLTIGEIRKGLAALKSGRRRSLLEAWLDTELAARFAGRVLPIDYAVADRWGRLAGEAQGSGAPLPVVDGLLAATALHHDLTVVSRNVRDLAVNGLTSFNPWDKSAE
jgi:predicted nucleic acid-binding protein